ncbi:NUDIX hydrolase [Candidatus Pacearchaeota archaeon]|nr:NUDIX hydrolase [Candidatus Pacearchaeota archaeon]
MKTYFAVTGILINDGNILILRKAMDDRNYPGKWSFCSGFVKEFESAEDNVLREIKEETGLKGKILKKGKIVETVDKKIGKIWVIIPFLCEVDSREVKLCHENMDFKWIKPEEFKNYDSVPGLEKDLKSFDLI